MLLELAEAEDDAGSLDRGRPTRSPRCTKAIEELEVRTLLSGEYDSREALVTIRAGAGGVDAADFAEMLLRMYLRWAERHGYPTEVYDTSYAEEAGHQVGHLRGQGAVRLRHAVASSRAPTGWSGSARSTTRAAGRRRSPAVEVVPVVEQTDEIDIPEDEMRVDVYRSSGPGGQGVNTTDSAVRLTHIPTGIVVTCQNERSQLQNKASAMGVLKAKLLDRKRPRRQAKMDALRGDVAGSWGDQMRSYVLHPYQMVKDLRTEHETGNPSAVFDGEIDGFIEAGIRWRKQRELDRRADG